MITLCCIGLTLTSCKKKGCIDATATNYNSKANKDDGSCIYPLAEPTPLVITVPFTAKVDGVEFVETTLTGTYSSTTQRIVIEAQNADQAIKICVPSSIMPGEYSFADPNTGSQAAYFTDGGNLSGAATGTGSLTIVSNTVPSAGTSGHISGMFLYEASPYTLGSGNGIYQITNGQFTLDYQ